MGYTDGDFKEVTSFKGFSERGRVVWQEWMLYKTFFNFADINHKWKRVLISSIYANECEFTYADNGDYFSFNFVSKN